MLIPPQLSLVRPSTELKPAFFQGFDELTTDSERSAWNYLGDASPLDIPAQNFGGYIDTLLKRETVPLQGFVCCSVYWAILNCEMLGRIAIRHELNDFLRTVGGHIGYIVRPSSRGQGVASEMLRQLLQTERARSIDKLLLTCDENNIASERTILKNGGIYESTVDASPNKPRKKRFWITLN
jgi:predicted acetyltransferase